MFDVEYDAFLMDYERDQPIVVTSMSLWINILAPIFHILMLGVNYYAWATTDVGAAVGSVQVAVTMLTAVSVLILLVVYYAVLDRCCVTSRWSVYKNFQTMDKMIQHLLEENNNEMKSRKKAAREERMSQKKGEEKKHTVTLSHDGRGVVELNTIDRRPSTLSEERIHY